MQRASTSLIHMKGDSLGLRCACSGPAPPQSERPSSAATMTGACMHARHKHWNFPFSSQMTNAACFHKPNPCNGRQPGPPPRMLWSSVAARRAAQHRCQDDQAPARAQRHSQPLQTQLMYGNTQPNLGTPPPCPGAARAADSKAISCHTTVCGSLGASLHSGHISQSHAGLQDMTVRVSTHCFTTLNDPILPLPQTLDCASLPCPGAADAAKRPDMTTREAAMRVDRES